jgi:predicted metal-dependent hydrolase
MKTEPRECLLQFGARNIPYRLHRTSRKTLRIVVSPDLTVNAFAPLRVRDSRVETAIFKKAPWIAKILDKLESYRPLPSLKRYVSGETFVYLGRQYRLKVTEGYKRVTKLNGPFLQVVVPDRTNNRMVKSAVEKWYRIRAAEVFRRYLDKSYMIASRHGIPFPELSIRGMQRRWGSCSSAKRVTLNLKLLQAPVHCIEYVIMHELCHLVQHDHSRGFYSLLTRCQPDWPKRKQTLDRITPV